MTRATLSAKTLIGDAVKNSQGEDLGQIEELMIDIDQGRVAYAVLSHGGTLGIGSKLFAIPWEALTVDTENKRFVLDIPREKLEKAPGFDKDNWPDFSSREWQTEIYRYYGYEPYWG